MLRFIHHWWLPVISAVVWWGMLIALLTCWAAQGHPVYPWIHNRKKDILYISDISATNLQPIFIVGAAVQGIFFVLGLGSERLLRHNGRLVSNTHKKERVASILALVSACIGQLGIILVSALNTRQFNGVHATMLVVFIFFVGLSSLASMYEYFHMNKAYPDFKFIQVSFHYKLIWFCAELAFVAGFGFSKISHINASAVLEWCISFVYPFYTLCIAYDLYPAHNTPKGFHKNARYPDPYGMSHFPDLEDEKEAAATDFY